MRVMLDTNILVSMIFFPSAQTKALATEATKHEIVICDYVIEELRLVTRRKFPTRERDLEWFFYELPFEMVYTPKALDLKGLPSVRDEKDAPILATAMLENIDVFITGDKDFLVLDVDTPEIVTMTEFLERF